jgi:hypothetical protein
MTMLSDVEDLEDELPALDAPAEARLRCLEWEEPEECLSLEDQEDFDDEESLLPVRDDRDRSNRTNAFANPEDYRDLILI